ncbi:hypothetical protein H3H32_22490 [Spirosoma foliorum]|uniref:Uncharacterized protein n=2 Tax=Spirosoma foliorum TaxID=2710596 RepID=A0A7G5GPF4_9BACT|nr:hypothetical protein H3H32_22490 [Spirosoma foliorum]
MTSGFRSGRFGWVSFAHPYSQRGRLTSFRLRCGRVGAVEEVLAGGITTLSTDFKQMGKTLAQLITTKAITTIGNSWHFNIRKSL